MEDNKFGACAECEKIIISRKLIHDEWYSKRLGFRIAGLICEECFYDSKPNYFSRNDARKAKL